ncbi:MAG: carbon starvation CstA family protein [Rikenellaceae bacterium]|nr:carbon starvation CstA family protein [Rikenellaceae bacterium]
MITFLVCLVLLVVAYFAHGSYLERVCKIDPKRAVPSKSLYDGVDYVPMSRWRTFLIQLLNIAGIGPIFGAIMGACFGPVAFLWITLGGIFMGAMHDFLSGVMLVRNDGLSISEIVGRYMGRATLQFMRIFSIILLILVGVVFLRSPASILGEMIPSVSYWWWIGIIIVYYFVATLLPIDKIIGKLYPLFGAALIFMAIGLAGVILFGDYSVPELSLSTLRNYQPNAEALPIVPTLFITIACGAISGFHATQSPLMARCIKSEGDCRSVFYGAMITESIIALIWAAIAMAFFHGPDKLAVALAEHGNSAAWVVNTISTSTLGIVGGILAVLGVVAAPITSGDTAFRSARLIVADSLHIEQRSIPKRLMICIPIFAIGLVLNFIDFDVVWRYFSWTNQALATVVLWTIVVYHRREGYNMWVALLPAIFMTYICSSFVFISNQFFGMEKRTVAYILGGVATVALTIAMWVKIKNTKPLQND